MRQMKLVDINHVEPQLCQDCGGAVSGTGNTASCGYSLCECSRPRPGLRIDRRDLCQKADRLAQDRQATIEQLQCQLDRARTYTGIEGYPCPLCHYEKGKFIEACEMHKKIQLYEEYLAKLGEILMDMPLEVASLMRKSL